MARGGARPGSGRPSGARNKATKKQTQTLTELAQSFAPEALETLVEVMRYGVSDAARITASVAVLDRGYGKPAQAPPEPAENSIGEWLADIQRKGSKPVIASDEPSPPKLEKASEAPPAPIKSPHSGGQLCLRVFDPKE